MPLPENSVIHVAKRNLATLIETINKRVQELDDEKKQLDLDRSRLDEGFAELAEGIAKLNIDRERFAADRRLPGPVPDQDSDPIPGKNGRKCPIRVKRLHPVSRKCLKEFSSMNSVLLQHQMSRATLAKALVSGDVVEGFIWELAAA